MANQNKQSGGEVAEQKHGSAGRLAKTDARYWQSRIFHAAFTREGKRISSPEFSARMQHRGRREEFNLGTANRAAAAGRAKEIYLHLVSAGWEATLTKFKPGTVAPESDCMATVGEFIAAAVSKASVRPRTMGDYTKSLRKIVADLEGIDGGREKFDHVHGGRQRWLERINAVSLSRLTPERIQQWKLDFVRAVGSSPARKRAARTTVNTLLSNARCLFSPRLLKFIALKLPDPLPFAGVQFEARNSMRYHSTVDAARLVGEAQEELAEAHPEQFKVFLLAIMAGLRRQEIDLLEWSALDFERGLIRIGATQFFSPKSEDSAGEVQVDLELLEIFRGYRARASGPFVIESKVAPRPGTTFRHYRCQRDFKGLVTWLRSKGIGSTNPIHTMRKEFGSLLCERAGIYEASRALRHADIAITAQHYLDSKKRVTVGLGGLLHTGSPPNIVPLPSPAGGLRPPLAGTR